MAEPVRFMTPAPALRGPKSPDAFRTISEVASELDLPQHVLRFWESKFVQVRPLKRGGGRRYYRPEDVDLLRGIRHLLHADGYTIKGVQKLIKENGIRAVVEVGRNGQSPRRTAAVAPVALAPPRQAPAAAPAGDRELQLRGLLGELEAIRALLPKG